MNLYIMVFMVSIMKDLLVFLYNGYYGCFMVTIMNDLSVFLDITLCKIICRIQLYRPYFFSSSNIFIYFSLFYNMLSVRMFYHPMNGIFQNNMNI